MARVVVLLGAGASVDAGLPTTVGMVDRLLEDFREQTEVRMPEPMRSRLRLLEFVVYTLRQQAAVRGDPVGVDVETMFDAIETLAQRNQLSIAPFIASWHQLIAEAERTTAAAQHWGTPESHLADLLVRSMNEVLQKSMGMSGWPENAAREFVRELLGTGDTRGSAFADLADAVLASLVRILQLRDPEKVRYLKPLVDLYRTQGYQDLDAGDRNDGDLDIATLNYDLTIETLGDLFGVRVDTGMDTWSKRGKVEFGGGIRLFKLHGSINWQKTPGVRVSSDEFVPVEGVERVLSGIPEKPAVIFGAGNKLKAGGPYLELLRRFEESLAASDRLVVVGYSFRDEHVNAVLTTWINAHVSRKAVILDKSAERFGAHVDYNNRTLVHELASIANRHPNRVKLLQLTAADGLVQAIDAALESSPAKTSGDG
jgi:SIR2-like protein